MSDLASMLIRQVERFPDKKAFVMTDSRCEIIEEMTFGELGRAARIIAAAIASTTPRGERVLLLCSGLNFIRSFFACQFAGVVGVPTSAPTLHGPYLQRLAQVLDDARAMTIIVDDGSQTQIANWLAAAGHRDVTLLVSEECLASTGTVEPVRPGDDAPCFLQYTSGTTGVPKGVVVRQMGIAANLALIKAAMGNDETTVGGGWLPLFHDMGLIGLVIQPVYLGITCYLMSPLSFVKRPLAWLKAIDRFGITNSGGPNFGFEHVLSRVGVADAAGLDLSRWRMCFTGSEPPRHDTMVRFAERFAPQGFRREAFYPCYGMAEATLFISGGDPGVAYAHLTGPKGAADVTVSAGTSAGFAITIVDPDSRHRMAVGESGEIWVRGASVAAGYWGNPVLSEAVFEARIADEPDDAPRGWLRTGDLGFQRDGELFVTGRLKDVIIVKGRKVHPQDIEHRLREFMPTLGDGTLVSFAATRDGTESVAVLFEAPVRATDDWSALAGQVRSILASDFGVSLDRFVVAGSGTAARTTSGKLQRAKIRDEFLAGTLRTIWSETGPAMPAIA